MLINKIRLLVQAFSFLILTYGGRIGINLGYALPCFACPYVAGCGGYCFLMFLQRVGIFGIAAYDRIFTYIGLQNLLWFLIFAVSAIILSKIPSKITLFLSLISLTIKIMSLLYDILPTMSPFFIFFI